MRILITGGRDYDHWTAFNKVLLPYAEMADLVIVHGHNPQGADAMADRWARMQHVKVERHPADWPRYRRSAGPIRNKEMVDLGADVCLAFPGPRSRGTWDCVEQAVHANIPVRVFDDQGEEVHDW